MKKFYLPIRLLFLIAFLTTTTVSHSQNCTSTATPFGIWQDNSTWSCSNYPSSTNCYDSIFIIEHVYMSTQIDLEACTTPIVIVIDDTLRLKNGKKLKLPLYSRIIITNSGVLHTGGSANANFITVGGSNVWSSEDGTLDEPTVLDVDYVSFTATNINSFVQLDWATATEINNDYFSIERSLDGVLFEEIGQLKGNGNSNELVSYQFTDLSPEKGPNFYRLKQIDYNGDYSFSKIIAANLKTNVFNIHPNPTSSNIQIHLSNTDNIQSIEITNQLGQKIKTIDIGQDGPISLIDIDVSSLTKGIYYLNISTLSENTYQNKFIKLE